MFAVALEKRSLLRFCIDRVVEGVWHEKVQAMLQFLHVPAPEFVRANGERLGKYHLEGPVAVADCRWFLGGFPFCKSLPADFEGDEQLAQKQYCNRLHGT